MALYLACTDHKGRGIFTDEFVAAGTVLEQFGGDLYTRAELPWDISICLQVDVDLFLGPKSTKFSDYTNHSCEPNCGVRLISPTEVYLIAIQDIPAGDELTIDYSTNMTEPLDQNRWTMECSCGTATCRGVVDQFCTLDPILQQHYIGLGVVPPFAQETIK